MEEVFVCLWWYRILLVVIRSCWLRECLKASNNAFDIVFISFSFISAMRKVLAQASVGPEHKELVLKDLKSIFKRIKITLDILLQEENYQQEPTSHPQPLFKSYPYITLTIPNYEQHRECNLCLSQTSRKSTRATCCSASSSSSSPRATATRTSSSSATRRYSGSTAGTGTTASAAPSTARPSSPTSRTR